MAEQNKSAIEEISESLSLVTKFLDKIHENQKVLNENQRVLKEQMERMDRNWSHGEYDEPRPEEVTNGVDSYPFREQFETLCETVRAIHSREQSNG